MRYNIFTLYNKAIRVLNSCKTLEQLDIAYNYTKLTIAKIKIETHGYYEFEKAIYNAYVTVYKNLGAEGDLELPPPPPRVERVKM